MRLLTVLLILTGFALLPGCSGPDQTIVVDPPIPPVSLLSGLEFPTYFREYAEGPYECKVGDKTITIDYLDILAVQGNRGVHLGTPCTPRHDYEDLVDEEDYTIEIGERIYEAVSRYTDESPMAGLYMRTETICRVDFGNALLRIIADYSSNQRFLSVQQLTSLEIEASNWVPIIRASRNGSSYRWSEGTLVIDSNDEAVVELRNGQSLSAKCERRYYNSF